MNEWIEKKKKLCVWCIEKKEFARESRVLAKLGHAQM